ncbi:hypothetical protein ACF1A5_07510 [Streptomyces sp. NPDC014864]|uniref:hypothetical protein n=1 Tax=Streptomyces sp. NPDC014864 TaxID=3364924 RepID=UPI0036F9F7C2
MTVPERDTTTVPERGTTTVSDRGSFTRLLSQAGEAAAPCTLNSRIRLSGRSHRMPHVR